MKTADAPFELKEPVEIGPRSWWANSMPRLKAGAWPWASIRQGEDGKREIVAEEITAEEFVDELPTNGWSGHFSRWEKGRFRSYGFVLGMRGGVAWELRADEARTYYRIGCKHELIDVSPRERQRHGYHEHECALCGLTISTDSSG